MTDNETVTHPATFGSKVHAYGVIDTYSDDPSYTPETYLGFVREGSEYALVNYGFLGANSSSFSDEQMNHAPYEIELKYPESVGLSWTNNFEYKGELLNLFSSCCGLEILGCAGDGVKRSG